MRLLEYEAKQLLSAHGAPIPEGQLITGADDTPTLPLPLVIKVQIPTGGRGKAGGVKRVETDTAFTETSRELLSQPILGYQAKTLLAEQAFQMVRELYIAITIDRSSQSLVLLAHKHGGIDIESAAHNSEMLRIPLNGEPDEQTTRKLFDYFDLADNLRQPLNDICHSLWETCIQEDALLVEVNPLIVTADDRLICADAKIELDDAAAFRHDWHFEQALKSTQFVILNEQGTVGSMANGAGLAMATVDAIQGAGAVPANFLDVGGGTNTDGMVAAFRKLSDLPNVKAIVVNIFGGITRCNEVADAIVAARESVPHLPALFIRLTGTNEAEGEKILQNAGVPILPDLKSCVDAAAKAAS
jgi:succinyl-CoA synthetase beta subunit